MALFGTKQKNDNSDVIISVVILEQTQLYKNKSKWGLTFGSTLSDGQVIAMDNQVPAGMEIKFSVTYQSGRKEIVKVMSGTPECDRLLQLAIDPPPIGKKENASLDRHKSVSIKKNQIPTGSYVIGMEIPAGKYDFSWVWGNGSICKNKINPNTNNEETNYLQNVGNQYDYEYTQCINVECTEGEILHIIGNLIVEISKSKPIEIDL